MCIFYDRVVRGCQFYEASDPMGPGGASPFVHWDLGCVGVGEEGGGGKGAS